MAGEEVKLHGVWSSPFTYRVIWALKLKSIPFQFVEEDLHNKSSLLLSYNPVHKKVPVLVHAGKPICDSLVILEYIEETWPLCPLLPVDPFERSMARFWIRFAQDKDVCGWEVFCNVGEEQEKAGKNTKEMLAILEEFRGCLGPEKKYFGGDNIGAVDIAFGFIAHWLGVIEQVIGVDIMEASKFPGLAKWIQDFKEEPTIKANLPNRTDMVMHLGHYRDNIMQSKA